MTDFVRQAIIRSGKFRVVDKQNMDKILSEQAFQQTGCTSSECAVKLGKLLNTRKMIVGELSMLAGVRYLTASLVDVETGEIERTARVKDFDSKSVDVATDRLASQLAEVNVSVTDDGMGGKPRISRARRHRTGLSIGLIGYPMTARLDFKNAPTPNAGAASAPYTNATIDINAGHAGPVLRAGWRGPIGRGDRWGLGIEGDVAPSTGKLAEQRTMATASNGQPVEFYTKNGGLDSVNAFGGVISVIYTLRPAFNVWAGARVQMFTVESQFHAYQLPNGGMVNYLGDGPIPGKRLTALYGEIGAEWLAGEHFGLECSLDLHPGGSPQQVVTTPFELTFTPPAVIVNLAVRGYF